MRFYGSSVLLVYCADSLARAREAQDASLLQLNCKLIDFQKTVFLKVGDEGANEIDEDCVKGLSNLIKEIQSL